MHTLFRSLYVFLRVLECHKGCEFSRRVSSDNESRATWGFHSFVLSTKQPCLYHEFSFTVLQSRSWNVFSHPLRVIELHCLQWEEAHPFLLTCDSTALLELRHIIALTTSCWIAYQRMEAHPPPLPPSLLRHTHRFFFTKGVYCLQMLYLL